MKKPRISLVLPLLAVLFAATGCDERAAPSGESYQTESGPATARYITGTGLASQSVEALSYQRACIHGQAERVIDLASATLLRLEDFENHVAMVDRLYNPGAVLRQTRFESSDLRNVWFEDAAGSHPLSTVKRPTSEMLATSRDIQADSEAMSLDHLRAKAALLNRFESDLKAYKRRVDAALPKLRALETSLRLHHDPAKAAGAMPTPVNGWSTPEEVRKRAGADRPTLEDLSEQQSASDAMGGMGGMTGLGGGFR